MSLNKTATKKLAAGLHAAVDELVASNPESATALQTILENLMQTETAVAVPNRKKGKAVVEADEDEDDDLVEDDEDDASEDDDDDLVEDDEDEAPKTKKNAKAKTKAPAKASAVKGRKAKPEPEDEEEEEEETEEDDGTESLDLDDLEAATIATAFDDIDFTAKHERVGGGIREMEAEIDDFGFDVEAVYKAAKAKDTKSKRAAATEFLSRAHDVIDAIMAFEIDGVVAAIEEITGEAFTPAGRAKAAKELSAATELFKAAIAAE